MSSTQLLSRHVIKTVGLAMLGSALLLLLLQLGLLCLIHYHKTKTYEKSPYSYLPAPVEYDTF